MGAGDGAQLGRTAQAGEGRKFTHVVAVGAPGFRVGDIGEPFELGRDLGQGTELRRRQRPLINRDQVFCHHPPPCFSTALPRQS